MKWGRGEEPKPTTEPKPEPRSEGELGGPCQRADAYDDGEEVREHTVTTMKDARAWLRMVIRGGGGIQSQQQRMSELGC